MTSPVEPRIPRHQEVRPLPPFVTVADALAGCRFAADREGVLDEVEHTYVERGRLHEGIAPHFRLVVDGSLLAERTGVDLKDLKLTVTVRDVASKRYRVLRSWPVTDVMEPVDWSSEEDQPLRSNGGFEFNLAVSLQQPKDRRPNRAHRIGSILAQRTFSVSPEADAISFPMKFVDFGPTRWPDDALWIVEYLQPDPDFSQPLGDILELQINKKAERKLTQLARTPAGAILMEEIAIGVFCQVATRALRAKVPDDADSNDGVLKQVVAGLQRVSDRDAGDLARLALEDPSEFRALAQQMYGIVPSIVGA